MENRSLPLIGHQQSNVFLIDWITVTFHSDTVTSIKAMLGLLDPTIAWESDRCFQNGYPMKDSFSNISIHWGADDPRYYDDTFDKSGKLKSGADKARSDMGISLNMSGQGCRAFEEYSDVGWEMLLTRIFAANGKITRLDLAYDDHAGILDIGRIRYDAEDRNYVSKTTKVKVHWSDDRKEDIQGITIEIGSRQSPVLIRIYDKAAERGYRPGERHWIRVEIQLRKDRAQEAGKLLFRKAHIGMVASGILRNYCTFRVPSADLNRSRWPMAYYWEQLLGTMEKLSVWVAPGEPYNFSRTENHFVLQYGQFMQAYMEIHGETGSLMDRSRKAHPVLHKKYLAAIQQAKLDTLQRQVRRIQEEAELENEAYQELKKHFAEIFGDDPDLPW